ncbi:MAG: hypothetical protein WA138_08170 [Parvibaculum sp.]
MTIQTTTELEPEPRKRRIEPILDASGTLRHISPTPPANDGDAEKARFRKSAAR